MLSVSVSISKFVGIFIVVGVDIGIGDRSKGIGLEWVVGTVVS
mgnify:CR=1 FL=1